MIQHGMIELLLAMSDVTNFLLEVFEIRVLL